MSQNYFPFEQLSALVYTPRWVEEETMVLLIKALKNRKLEKNKEKVDWQIFQPNSIGENKELPILVSEELLAEMKKMSPQ